MRKTIPFLLAVVLVLLTACTPNSSPTPVSSSSEKAGSSSSSSVSSSGSGESGLEQSSAPPASADLTSTPASAPASPASPEASSAGPASSREDKTKTVQITIPEGFTLRQIAARLEAKDVCGSAELIQAAQTYDFSYYPLVSKIPDNVNRCYKLEGYLYPDTYEFYIGMKPQDAVGKFLRNTEQQIGNSYAYSGMTTDQLITLASIIEREADDTDNMRKVSSVFHNRLKIGMILQADSTREYCNVSLVPTFGDKFNQYYNTYRCSGLPTGPISNPGANALNAAAHPADTDYLYFATGTDHNYYYGTTQEDRDALMASAGVTPLYAD